MSNIANITVFDGAATPVSHTLVPESVTRSNGRITAEWRETLAGLPQYAQLRMIQTKEQTKNRTYKVEQRVVVPVMEAVNGQNAAGYTAAPRVAYEDTMVHTGWFHERSTITGRRLVRQLSVNLSGGVSTSVTPVQTGFFPELVDLLVAAT